MPGGFLGKRAVCGDKNHGVPTGAQRIERGERRPGASPLFIDRGAQHDRLAFETGVTKTGSRMSIDSGEYHRDLTEGSDQMMLRLSTSVQRRKRVKVRGVVIPSPVVVAIEKLM